MKPLFLLPILFMLFFQRTNAQNNRWMYLANSTEINFFVDTVKNDAKQLNFFEGHSHIVLVWIKTQPIKIGQDSSSIESNIAHFAVDTASSEMATKSITTYRGDNVIRSQTIDILKWEDVLPGSTGEAIIGYCRALNNTMLMLLYRLGALQHDFKPASNKN